MKSSVHAGGTVSLSVDAWQSDYVTIRADGHPRRSFDESQRSLSAQDDSSCWSWGGGGGEAAVLDA